MAISLSYLWDSQHPHVSLLSIYLGHSAETSDFIVDCLTAWWSENQHNYLELDEWVIDLDGGASTRSNRTQFIKRMVELSQAINLKIRLIYYPPRKSKYNPIERCWAANMTWKGISPIVHLVETTYEKGIKVLSQELEQYQPQWQRSETLPKWDITIVPV